jgi:hypothetical protein
VRRKACALAGGLVTWKQQFRDWEGKEDDGTAEVSSHARCGAVILGTWPRAGGGRPWSLASTGGAVVTIAARDEGAGDVDWRAASACLAGRWQRWGGSVGEQPPGSFFFNFHLFPFSTNVFYFHNCADVWDLVHLRIFFCHVS